MPSASEGEPSEPGSVRTVLEYLDAAVNDDFYLKVRFVTAGKETPKKIEVVSVVQAWLSSLAWSDWWHETDGVEAQRPEAELPVRDWLLGLTALPRSPARRGVRDAPMIVVYLGITGWPDAVADQVGPKLEEKANKYGDLDAPYVIASWFMSAFASEGTAAQTLFGISVPWEDGRHRLDLQSGEKAHRGLWTADRPHRGRVSGLLAANSFDFNYSAIARVTPRLWLNPWADQRLSVNLPYAISCVSSYQASVENVPGAMDAATLVGVPHDWPGRPFEEE